MQSEDHEIEAEFPEFRQRIKDLSVVEPDFAELKDKVYSRIRSGD